MQPIVSTRDGDHEKSLRRGASVGHLGSGMDRLVTQMQLVEILFDDTQKETKALKRTLAKGRSGTGSETATGRLSPERAAAEGADEPPRAGDCVEDAQASPGAQASNERTWRTRGQAALPSITTTILEEADGLLDDAADALVKLITPTARGRRGNARGEGMSPSGAAAEKKKDEQAASEDPSQPAGLHVCKPLRSPASPCQTQ